MEELQASKKWLSFNKYFQRERGFPLFLFVFCFSLQASLCCFSQEKFDNTWLLGYDGNGVLIKFENDTIGIDSIDIVLELLAANAAICDSSGTLLFYCNGEYIANSSHQPMPNGQIDIGELSNSFPYGVNVTQLALILPNPGNADQYYLFYKALYYPFLQVLGSKFYYAIIDMSLNGGLGGIFEKNHLVIEETYLDWGQLTACKHANGRDWWLLIGEFDTNDYNRFLLAPEGLVNHGKQSIGFQVYSGAGQAIYSPDGSKYARLNQIEVEIGNYIDIYDFDRCEGTLSNHLQMHYIDSAFAGGAAFSPNSRFLYISSTNYLYQFDMQAADIPASKEVVGVYDGFLSPFWASFFLAQLAPDHKIYINAPNGVDVMHVINQPNEKGAACDFQQHSISLPAYNAFSLPNYPYFRLGALEGSPCDTIGISPVKEITEVLTGFRLEPNPGTSIVRLYPSHPLDRAAHLKVIDLNGKEVYQMGLSGFQSEYVLDISSLPQGIYLYEVSDGAHRLGSGKLVKVE